MTRLIDCNITRCDTDVISYCVLSQSDDLYQTTKQLHTGVDLSAKSQIYNFVYGTVIRIGQADPGYIVTVQHSSNICFQYVHLSSVIVSVGQFVDSRELIGYTKTPIHVEYLTTELSQWPVRLGSNTFYKHDPLPILISGVTTDVMDYIQHVQALRSITNLTIPTEYTGGKK